MPMYKSTPKDMNNPDSYRDGHSMIGTNKD